MKGTDLHIGYFRPRYFHKISHCVHLKLTLSYRYLAYTLEGKNRLLNINSGRNLKLENRCKDQNIIFTSAPWKKPCNALELL